MTDDFALFITSHGSPHECVTLDTLRKCGYTGKYFIVVDNMDPCLDFYDDTVVVFDKNYYVNKLDTGISTYTPQYAAVLYARAFIEDYARQLNLSYFVIMDDDLSKFRLRYPKQDKLGSFKIKNMDNVFISCIEYLKDSKLCCLSFANNGSLIGGISSLITGKVMDRRSCHTVFIRNASIDFDWTFAINEDYISSLRNTQSGKILFTIPFVQRDTAGINNRESGGMHDVYKSTSEFERAFYAVLVYPNACSVKKYKKSFVIQVNKDNMYPKIISDYYKRGDSYGII